MSSFTMPVSRYMTAPTHAIDASDPLQAAYHRLRDLDISSLAVADNSGRLVGVISRTDLLRVGRGQTDSRRIGDLLTFPEKPIAELMIRDVVGVSPGDSVQRACELMIHHQVHRVFVTERAKPPSASSAPATS